MIFLDTNVLSEAMRIAPDARVMRWLGALGERGSVSTVVLAELRFGIERIRPSERAPRLANVLAELVHGYAGRIHGFDLDAAFIYGEIMGKASRAGRPMQAPDGMIAAISLRHKAELATRNVRDFEALGVTVVNPWE